MDKVRIHGGRKLSGTVEVGGSKNAALPILIGSILAEGISKFTRVPNLQDVRTTLKLLSFLGLEDRERPCTQSRFDRRVEAHGIRGAL